MIKVLSLPILRYTELFELNCYKEGFYGQGSFYIYIFIYLMW